MCVFVLRIVIFVSLMGTRQSLSIVKVQLKMVMKAQSVRDVAFYLSSC